MDVPDDKIDYQLRPCNYRNLRRALRKKQQKTSKKGAIVARTRGEEIRHEFEEYFLVDHPVPWQNDEL